MSQPNRRDFLKRSVAGSAFATFAASGTKASGQVLGANDRIRIAVAGINGQGRWRHLRGLGPMQDVEIAYIVDPDSRLFASGSKMVREIAGNTPVCVQDVRQALDDKTLDAVSVVTPNISYRLGENASFDSVTKVFDGNQTFGESFENMKRHLADTGQVDLANSTYRLGRTLSFDAEAETFVGAPDANQLLTRPYRGPFVVPERV
jgi:hypothetical protein